MRNRSFLGHPAAIVLLPDGKRSYTVQQIADRLGVECHRHLDADKPVSA
ncbi:hypothetical protein ACIBIZ_11375 [Nonomuraea spiralis]